MFLGAPVESRMMEHPNPGMMRRLWRHWFAAHYWGWTPAETDAVPPRHLKAIMDIERALSAAHKIKREELGLGE